MKKIFLLLLTFFAIANISYAQITSVVGKWKPVAFEIEGLYKVNLKTGEKGFVKSAQDKIAVDKELAEKMKVFKSMMEFLGETMEKVNEEYTADGKYFEINLPSKGKKESNYTFNAKTKTLVVTSKNTKEQNVFVIEFNQTGFVTIGDMDDMTDPTKKVKIKITYEKA